MTTFIITQEVLQGIHQHSTCWCSPMLPVPVTAPWGHSPCTPIYTSSIPVLVHIYHTYFIWWHSTCWLSWSSLQPFHTHFTLKMMTFKISQEVFRIHSFLLEDSDVDHPMLFDVVNRSYLWNHNIELPMCEHSRSSIYPHIIHRLPLWLNGS